MWIASSCLRVNTEEMQVEILLDAPVSEAVALMTPEGQGKRMFSLSRPVKKERPKSEIRTTKEATYKGYVIRELENGSIEVERDGSLQSPAKPVLRKLARQLNLTLLNSNGNPLNTRQLGNQVIKTIDELEANEAQQAAPGNGSRADVHLHTIYTMGGFLMKSEIEELVEKALKLPSTARAALAELLLESLDYEEDFLISDEWMNEIQKRCREIDEGKVKLISAEDALAQLQKKYS
jgi:putative addiction module component (TIGR02574 family)